jgi:hypothetical protein
MIFDSSDNEELYISGYFEGNSQSNFSIFLVLNEMILVEIDLNRSEQLPVSSLVNFLSKFKAEGRSKLVKFEFPGINKNATNINNYSILINSDDSKNVKSVWKFNEKILSLKFRPKPYLQSTQFKSKYYEDLYNENSHFFVSFSGGKLKVFHYESKSLIYDYKTIYGNIITAEYSSDGRVLGIGTESDNVFILDAEYGSLLYCFEGHRNFVTSIHFEEVGIEDELVEKNNPSNIYESAEILNTNYDTNRNNYNSVSSVMPKQSITNKEVQANDFMTMFASCQEDLTLDLRTLKRTRTSANLTNLGLQEELRASTTYDIFTAGLDGYLGVWRIEHFYEEGSINDNNYINLPYTKENSLIVKQDTPGVINITPRENIKVFFADMVKASKCPINKFLIYDNALVLMCKRNTNGSYCYLSMFHYANKSEEIISTNSNIIAEESGNIQTSNSLKNKMNEMSLKNFDTPIKEKKLTSMSPMKKYNTNVKDSLEAGNGTINIGSAKPNSRTANGSPERKTRLESNKK